MVMRVTAVILLTTLSAPVMADSPSDSVDVQLDAYRWEHRVLLVFAPPGVSEQLEAQKAELESHARGFRDRDLLLFTITDETDGTLQEAPGDTARSLTAASVRRLYDHFGVPRDAFRVILVGKDGTEKRRDAEPVSARSVFDTIDAMPMRQQEMRDSASGEGTTVEDG